MCDCFICANTSGHIFGLFLYKSKLERRRDRVVRASWLRCWRSPEGCRFKLGLGHRATEKQSVNTGEKERLFRIRKDKAANGEGCTPSFICLAQGTVGLKLLMSLRPIGFEKLLPSFTSPYFATKSSHKYNL